MLRSHKMILVILLLFTISVYAELSFEATYENSEHLTVGAPSGGLLLGSTSVSSGWLVVPSGNNGCNYGPPADAYLDVSNDGTDWGTNTIAGIFRLNSAAEGDRQTLVAVGFTSPYDGNKYSGWKGMQLFVNDASTRVQLQLIGDYWGSPDGVVSKSLDTFGVNVQANVTYFVGASWQDASPNDDIVNVTLYLREVSDIDGLAAAFDNTLGENDTNVSSGATDWDKQYVMAGYFSQSGSSGTHQGTLNGEIDLLRFYRGEYMATEAQWDSLFRFTVLGEVGECIRAIEAGMGLEADINEDCYVNIDDLSEFAAEWLNCTTPGLSGCETPWLP